MTPEDVIRVIKEKLKVDPEEGILRLFGIRFCLATPNHLVVIQRTLETIMGSSAKAPIYLAGEEAAKTVGARAAKDLVARGKFSEAEEAVEHLVTLWSAYGHGRIEIDLIDLAKGRLDFTLKNSFIAEAYGPSETPVCHFYAGFGAGLVRGLSEEDVHCEELACSAMGAERCEFRIAPLDHFSNLVPRVMSARH